MSYGRPDHIPTSLDGLCARCGQPSSSHRFRNRNIPSRSAEYVSARNDSHPRPNPSERIIGIDGEGQGRGPHRYTYLAAADEFGQKWCISSGVQLSTEDCLDFILALPRRSLIFGYAFVYDLTKILQDLSDRQLYELFHDKVRERLFRNPDGKMSIRHKAVRWGAYKLNYVNRRFSVAKDGRSATIWDVFAFFQSKFTKALIDWEIASKQRLTDMERMKELRSSFDQLSEKAVHEYCDEECLYLSKLGRQLLSIHADCGLRLKRFYGAGSTAAVLLDRMDVLTYRAPPKEEMREALACAFFGGRFENSWCGPVQGPVYNYDISSAYPYHCYRLPCLVCGKWEKTKSESRILESRLSLIHWIIRAITPSAWGVLPVRSPKGTIAFPLSSDGGWTWKDEFIAARKVNPNVDFTEAWVYNTDCDHRPFKELAAIYRERVRIGKEARGIPLKLGPNSVYGKIAQSRGGLEPPYQSWIWAGNITSGPRAQLLGALDNVADQWDVLMYATDGIQSRQRLSLPKPVDTGTGDLAKPLGGWEEKVYENGVFYVRPGIYFPMSPTESELEKVRARGLGRKVVYQQWQTIVDAWERGEKKVSIGGIQRFIGGKTGTSYSRGKGYSRSKYYGEWVLHKVEATFHPAPKRETTLADGRLTPWTWLPHSVPYGQALESPETLALKLAMRIAEEQPDGDFTEIDVQEIVE